MKITGEHASAIDDLRGLIGEHPYREDLWQQLILALHRGGRRAEALHAYTEIRRQLVDELGIEPGQELREAHARVLAHRILRGVLDHHRLERKLASFE